MSDINAQLPSDVPSLHSIIKTAVAKLMAHSQTVQELLKANMDLRAALHMAQSDKSQLEAYLQGMINPAPAQEAPAADTPVDNGAVMDSNVAVDSNASTAEPVADANTVSA